MSGLQLERLQDQMRRLRLGRSVEQLPALLEAAAKREVSYSDFLEELLTSEITGKHERNTSMRVAMAHFPFVKTLTQPKLLIVDSCGVPGYVKYP